MSYEGPLPDEALPAGEEPLQPSELDMLATLMFEFEDIAREHLPNRTVESDFTQEQWRALQSAKRVLQGQFIDELKQVLIDQRD